MNRVPSRMIAALFVFFSASIVSAQPTEGVRRLRGTIDKDETWSGTILITDNLAIDGATVRVTPGTTIEFASGDPRRRPTLTVGAEVPKGTTGLPRLDEPDRKGANVAFQDAGRLELQGSAERPIVVRTADKSGPGRIVVIVRNKIKTNRLEQGTLNEKVTTTQIADQMNWRHVRFERMGFTEVQRAAQRDIDVSQPGVQVLIRQGGQEVSLESCSFSDCSHLLVQTEPDCDVRIKACRFENSTDPSSLKITSLDPRVRASSVRVLDNVACGMVVLAAGPAEFTGNRIIGPRAAVAVRQEAAGDIRIESNYVHCTDTSDTGRYVLSVEQPDAVVKDNVLIGGTYVVHRGSRNMSGNVLIAAPRLANDKGGKARTLRLVASLPKGAVFEGNVLIGPASAMVGPQAPLVSASATGGELGTGVGSTTAAATQISRNVFDGVDGHTKVLQLTMPRAAGGAVVYFDNLVLRCGPVAIDSTPTSDGLEFADYNAIIGGPEQLFLRASVAGRRPGEDGWSRHDRRHATADLVGLAAPPETLPDFDADVANGTITVAEARGRYFDPYRPRSSSPLIGAGRPHGDPPRAGTIGLPPASKN